MDINKNSGSISNTGANSTNITGTVKGDVIIHKGMTKEELIASLSEVDDIQVIKNTLNEVMNKYDTLNISFKEIYDCFNDKVTQLNYSFNEFIPIFIQKSDDNGKKLDYIIQNIDKSKNNKNSEDYQKLSVEYEKLENEKIELEKEKDELENIIDYLIIEQDSSKKPWLSVPLNETELPKNTSRKGKKYFIKAKNGDRIAQYKLACCIAGDNEQYEYWLTKSAEGGYVKAQESLGYFYYDDDIIRWGNEEKYRFKDNNKAVYWFKKAKENNSTNAIYELGECYLYGYGVEKNYDYAFQLFDLYTKKRPDSDLGWEILEECYSNGYGVTKDSIKADKCKKESLKIMPIKRMKYLLLTDFILFIIAFPVYVVFYFLNYIKLPSLLGGIGLTSLILVLLSVLIMFIYCILWIYYKNKGQTVVKEVFYFEYIKFWKSLFCSMCPLIVIVCSIGFLAGSSIGGNPFWERISVYDYQQYGVFYELYKDGEHYIPVDYLGNKNEITVLTQLNGKEVYFMSFGLFKKVVVAEGMTKIGNTFRYSNLKSIEIPASITEIDYGAFTRCSQLESIIVNENNQKYKSVDNCLLTKDGKTLIAGCKNSIIPSTVTSIAVSAFYGCTELTNIVLPDNVEDISGMAFAYTGLTDLIIPNSIDTIYAAAFLDCKNLEKVYYIGTENDWNKIYIGFSNEDLINATRYYFSESKPVEKGNYWHYEDNKPVIWE